MTLPRLDVRAAALGGVPGLEARGEVDAATAGKLGEALDNAILASRGAFVLDLDGVRFMDSTGINVLLRARALLGREERTLVLVCPPGPVRRVIDVVGIADLFRLYASREEARRALVPAS